MVRKANVSVKIGVWPLKDLHQGTDQICQASSITTPHFAFASMQRVCLKTEAKDLKIQIQVLPPLKNTSPGNQQSPM